MVLQNLLNKWVILLVFLLSFNAEAQISITNTVFPQPGEMRFTATDTAAMGASITPSSASAQAWKFTAYQPWQADTVVVLDAALGGAVSSFPEADIILPFFGGEGYFDNSGDSLELLGFFGDPGFGVSFLVEPTSSSVILSTPVTYGDIFEDDFSFTQAIDPEDFPALGEFLPPFPPIDSIRAIYASHREDTVDAWGSMSTHFGSFDVLRAKSVDYTNLVIEFKTFGIWVNPASIGLEIPFGGMDTAITYNFLNNFEKVPVVSVNVNNDGSLGSVVYLTDPSVVTSVDQFAEQENGFEVFPNPSYNLLNIIIESQTEQRFQALFYDANGRLARSTSGLEANGIRNEVNVDNLIPGVYFLNLLEDSGKLYGVRRVVILD
ncbi:MAG: T9SS type A sorting domain-containing protein [Bacteroidota bacterium]